VTEKYRTGRPGRAGTKVWDAEIGSPRRAGQALPAGALADNLRKILMQWVLAEVAPGRLMPWLPVAFGFGIVGYFSADREPALWAVLALATGAIVGAVVARRSPIGFPLAIGIAAVAAGFATATLKTVRIAHPVLQFPASSVAISGFVEVREERERSDRITIRVQHMEGRHLHGTPERVRVAVRKGLAPAVGSFIALKAHLSPPLAPLRPGGYDFARDMYFKSIGASGYVLGKIQTVSAPVQADRWLNYLAFIERLRGAIDGRIRTIAPGDRGAIASALITGKRNAMTEPVSDAFYASSLAHVLAISGYHMAVVAGIVFFVVRAGLALIPSLARRHPIKKWAAAAAVFAAGTYLVLSGASVSTQRSFIMIAIVLLGVMVDRPAITFRTLTVAAFGVLVLAPQSVIHPGFQMSFAATVALIAGYQFGTPGRASTDSSLAMRAALWGVSEIVGLILVSLLAGAATTPYAAYHFHRLAPYGVLANLLAMPVVSVWVMPMGILGLLTQPFGFDAMFWHLMADGIDWMIAVALWVTSLPGAVGHVRAFGTGPLLVGTAGLLLVCLLHTPLRWSGAVLAVIAGLWAVTTPRPDVLISGDGQTVAIRGVDGRLAVLRKSRDAFAIKEWLAADGDERNAADASLRAGVQCDAIGCIGRLFDGRLVTVALTAEALTEDCARAAVVVSPRDAPGACAAILVDRKTWRALGAVTLHWTGERFERMVVHPAEVDRPWAPSVLGPKRDNGRASGRRNAKDATPRLDNLTPDD
jgi:competence protein ComEC